MNDSTSYYSYWDPNWIVLGASNIHIFDVKTIRRSATVVYISACAYNMHDVFIMENRSGYTLRGGCLRTRCISRSFKVPKLPIVLGFDIGFSARRMNLNLWRYHLRRFFVAARSHSRTARTTRKPWRTAARKDAFRNVGQDVDYTWLS